MDGQTDGWTDGRMDSWMDGQTDGWTDGRMDNWMDGRTDGRNDGCMDGRTSRMMDLLWVWTNKTAQGVLPAVIIPQ